MHACMRVHAQAGWLSKCAAAGELLAPAGFRLPLVPVWGLSVTAPVNHVDGQLPHAPRAAVIGGFPYLT